MISDASFTPIMSPVHIAEVCGARVRFYAVPGGGLWHCGDDLHRALQLDFEQRKRLRFIPWSTIDDDRMLIVDESGVAIIMHSVRTVSAIGLAHSVFGLPAGFVDEWLGANDAALAALNATLVDDDRAAAAATMAEHAEQIRLLTSGRSATEP